MPRLENKEFFKFISRHFFEIEIFVLKTQTLPIS